jgi:hypothetical protein
LLILFSPSAAAHRGFFRGEFGIELLADSVPANFCGFARRIPARNICGEYGPRFGEDRLIIGPVRRCIGAVRLDLRVLRIDVPVRCSVAGRPIYVQRNIGVSVDCWVVVVISHDLLPLSWFRGAPGRDQVGALNQPPMNPVYTIKLELQALSGIYRK